LDFKIKSLKRYAEFLPILAFAVALVLGSIAGLNHGMIGKTTSFNPLKEISIAIGLDNTGLDKTVEIQKAPEPKEAEKPSISRGSFVAGGSSGGGSFQTTVEQHGDYPVYHAKMIGYEDPFQIKDYTVKVIGDKEIFVNFTLGFNDSWTKKELMQHYSADKDVSICIRNRQTSFNNISDMDTNFPVGLLKKGFYEYNQDGKAWVCSTITGSNLWSNLGVIREQGRWFSGVIHLSDWANFEISFGTGSTVILLSFAPPTLADNATITATSAQINISITNASDLAEMKFNWNGTNYTIYNDSLLLMLNFDSVDNSTKVNDVSRYGNNGTLSGSNFANFDDSPDSFVADCDAAVNYSFVSGKFGDAVKIWSNSGASGEGCFYKYTGTLKAGNVFWVWAKGRVMMQLHNGTRLSQIEDMAGNIYAYNTGQNYSDWTLFKLVVTENSSAAGNMLILYSRESASGEENAGYYDFIWNGTYFANGKYGSALSFDGVNDFMQGTGVGTKANDYSFSLWIKPSQIGVFMDIIEFNKNNFYPALTVASDNRFLLYLNPTYYLYSIGNAEYQSKKDTWIHLAATINSSNYTRLYINGVDQSGSGDLSGSPAAMNNEYVLANVYYSIQYFNGSIDEVRVWNRSLSASEVKQLYYSNFNKYDIDKWLFYVNESNLTDGTYTYYGYAKDTSGNENTTGTRTLTAGIPSIQFVSPTPSNGTVTTNTSVVINVSITEVNLKEVKKNWNGTNYTFYNDSLLLMMNFDNVSALGENATKAVDVSKWGNNGTLGNATAGTQPTWNATGRYGGAYTFDGVNDYIETPSINIGTGAVTFSAWVKGNVMGANHEQGIIEFYNSTRPWFFTLEKATYNNTLTIYVGYNDQTPNTISSPSGLWPASDTNWHHVLMTRNSSEIVLYFDGNRVANSSHSNFVNFNIGNRPVRVGYPSEQYWDGSIDEVRVWNRSLSADEIKQQYYSNLNKYDTDKWIFYENESLPEPYSSMTYNYYSCAKDTAGNENCTDTRQLTSQSIMPLISFVSPTPDNRTNTTNTSFVINVSITEANLNTLTKNWNGTNYTFYNDSLVLMMNFENLSVLGENSTFVKDLSKYGNNGNCSGTGCPTWNVSGRYGGAYTFDGVNDYVTLARPISGIQSANYSISAWVRQSAGVGATNFNEIFYQGYDGAHEIRLELNVVNCHAVFNTYEAGYGSVSGTTNACDGRWHYLTAVKSGNTGYIYVDGNQQNSGTVKNVTSTDRATIGAARYTGGIVYFFNGSIDEVRIWNRSLSADEVKQQYYSNLNKYDVDKWIFYENESLPEPYSSMTYNYYSCAKDAGGNENCTETRQLTSQSITPLISFVSPTPENGTTTTNTSVITNVSITEANLKEVKKNWNGTNYTLYNDSLIVIYNFDNVSALGENSTYAVDVSKWGNDGACSGTTCPVWTQSGKYGGAYVFDGVDDYIETASSNLLNITNPFSLFSWIKAKQDTDSYNAIAGQYNFSYPNGYGYLLYLTGGKIRANVYAGASGSSPLTIGTNYLNDSTWHYVGFTFNGSIVNLYEDGILVSNSSFSYYPLMLSNKITIGLRRPYTADQMPFNGSIDEVRLWNRSLSADEIKQQYYSNLNKYDTAKWILYENESLPEPYGSMTYNYYSCAKDTGGNENCTETRTLTSQATYPGVSFVSPTPANGTSTTNTSIVINVSITNASNLAEIKKNWNGTNYTFYNDSLVLMMNFDNVSALGENSSLVKDLSKYGNNGTCSGTTCPTWNASGRYGGAYKFDGNNDYIDAGDINATDNTTSLTYEAWIYRTGGDTTGGIISKYASTSSLVTLSLGGTISGGDDLVLRVSNGSTSYGYTSSNLISLNQWYHVVMVFNGSATGNAERLKLYLNNENRTLNFSGTIPSTTPSTTSSVLIGWYADKQHYFGGMIDEARIWNRSLTADEVKQHYYSNLNKYDADKWILYENESNLTVGDYTYFSCAKDIIGNENCTETRSLTIISGVDTTAPYWHNNQSNHTTKYGEDVWFSVNWTDDTAVDYSIFSYNSTDNALLTNDTAYDCNDALTCLHNVTKTITQTRGETFCWMFYANDTSNNWNETDLWCFEIENTAPTHTTPILNASGYENYTTYDLTCYNQSTNDVDGDPVTNRFQWYKNGVEQTALENITTVLSGNTSAGEVWRCEITPNDGYADGITRASNNLTILELPDTTPPLVFLNLPANATSFTATNNVTFNVSATDNVDLDNCTLYTNISGTWQSNGTKVFAGTSYSDVWGVYNLNNGTYVWNAYCCDNSSNCNWNNTNFTFTVSYTPPDTTPPLVFLNLPANATNFTSTNNVTFNVSATEDTDLDNCTLYTNISGSWSANETKTFTGTSDEDLWNFYNLTIGNYKWNAYCCDNSSNCAWNNTNFTFTVSYTPSVPDTEAPLVFLNSPANGQVFGATNDITFNVSATDNVDLDNCTLYTNVSGSWQANETKTFTGLSDEDIWTLNDLANGDYKWNAYCCDNNSNCAWNNTNFTFTVNIGAANNPPTHTKPVLNSTYGTNYTYENLTCYNQSTSDSDGDPVTNRFQWYNNGVEQTSLENLTTVVAGYTAKGENWSCAVTPNDGEDDGTTLFSDNLTIRNALPTQSTPYIGAHNIFTNGLVAEYQFEDRAKDETGVNNGTINGATWTDEGRVGKAYEFDGVDDTISISDDTSLSFGNGSDDNSLSISAWINMKDATGFGILSKDDYSSNREYGFFTVGSDVLAVYFFDQSTGGYIGRLAPAMTSYEGIWVHVAATYTGSGTNEGIKLYVNGIQVDNGNNSDGNYTAMENLASPVQIARKTSLYGEGTIDEVLIFNRSLHPSEILLIYNTSKGDYADSNQDLGCSANNTYDADNDTVKNIYNWYMNDSSIAVLNMPFEAGSNSTWTRDYTPFGNNGTVTNAIWNSTGGYDNKGAYEFDGDDYINVGTGVNLQDKYTIVAWFKTIDSSIYQTIFGSDTGSEALLRIVDGKLTGTAYVGFYAEWPNYYVSGLTTIQNNIWYHVAFVVDGVNLTLYLNGAKDGNDTAQAINITNNNNPSYIGQTGMSWSRQWWNGTIDEVLVFNRSLTAEQILELYNNRTQTIVANETSCGENWSCEITPNDQDPDGATFGSKDVPICCDGDGDGFCSLVDCDETATYIYSAPDGTCDEDNDGFIDYEAFVDPFAAIALGEQPDFVPENNKCQCVVNDAATHCNPPGGPIQKWCTVADVTCGSCDLLSCTSNEQCTKFGEGWHCVEHSPGTCEGPGPVPEFTTIGIIAAIIISLLGAVLIVHRRIKKKKHKKTKKKKR